MHLQFAKERNKPIAFCESGVGLGPSNPNQGIADDGDFPTYNFLLFLFLFVLSIEYCCRYLKKQVEGSGLELIYINIWDVNVGDGLWKFSDGSKPKAAAAWKAAFGNQN